ncbi:MAG: hypothetical protein ABIB79_04065 [archaeon]
MKRDMWNGTYFRRSLNKRKTSLKDNFDKFPGLYETLDLNAICWSTDSKNGGCFRKVCLDTLREYRSNFGGVEEMFKFCKTFIFETFRDYAEEDQRSLDKLSRTCLKESLELSEKYRQRIVKIDSSLDQYHKRHDTALESTCENDAKSTLINIKKFNPSSKSFELLEKGLLGLVDICIFESVNADVIAQIYGDGERMHTRMREQEYERLKEKKII